MTQALFKEEGQADYAGWVGTVLRSRQKGVAKELPFRAYSHLSRIGLSNLAKSVISRRRANERKDVLQTPIHPACEAKLALRLVMLYNSSHHTSEGIGNNYRDDVDDNCQHSYTYNNFMMLHRDTDSNCLTGTPMAMATPIATATATAVCSHENKI
ncbi:hypothetical protein PoB_000559200 [Plakobranchus ocellatus]|uniref:Uncharacterized protein n=1 Tax=Plakobranchus ocellatus TaxID=259542 RepID=A0AAV3YAF3_9GAST|nr:hypothetical protein PoB_000559200 [Plakobranchus ocellatus]